MRAAAFISGSLRPKWQRRGARLPNCGPGNYKPSRPISKLLHINPEATCNLLWAPHQPLRLTVLPQWPDTPLAVRCGSLTCTSISEELQSFGFPTRPLDSHVASSSRDWVRSASSTLSLSYCNHHEGEAGPNMSMISMDIFRILKWGGWLSGF